MNTAEVIKFPRQPDKPGGQVADLENGYLRLANQIQDAVCKVELSGREFRVLNAVIRLTYGWSKKEDRITNSLIADKTGLAVKHVSEAVLTLATRRIILLRRIGQTRYIGINTELNRWAYGKPKCKSCVISFSQTTEENYYRIEITIPENGDSKKEPQTIPGIRDNHPQEQGKASPETGNTKDILSNTDKHKDLNPLLSPKDKSKPKRSTQFPDGFLPTTTHQELADKLSVNLQGEFEAFSDYHRSKGSTFKDWGLALNTWLRNADKFRKPASRVSSVARPSKPMNHIPEGFTG